MTGTPAVSICIPSYNYAAFLPQALDSALGQSARDLEVLVVDNGSDDGTMEILEGYARRDPRVVVRRNEANVGMMGNFNRCIELARGRYVKFLCADDTLEPRCVERLLSAMETTPGVRLAACARRYFGGSRDRVLGYASDDRVAPGSEVIRDCFYRGNLLGEPTAVMFRRADAGTGFDPRYHQAFDMELWLRLLDHGALAYLAEPLCGIREHGATGTFANLRTARVSSDKVRLYAERASGLTASPLDKLRWDARMASSVARELAAGGAPRLEQVLGAVHHPRLFRLLGLPLAHVVTALRR
jgi:glycosyltransferase involved in cell wall biosynthesis